jgi:hypothetical protein
MPQIDLAFEVGEQKRDLGSVGNGWFHCRGLQGLSGSKAGFTCNPTQQEPCLLHYIKIA